MKILYFGLAIVLGAACYYGLSVVSALWISGAEYPWSLVVAGLVAVILGAVVARGRAFALAVAATLAGLVAVGLVTGGASNVWVAPLPQDLLSIFFHGSRSPLVIGSVLLVGTAVVVRAVRREPQDFPASKAVREEEDSSV